MTLTGGCRCGETRYVITGDRMPPIYCCHCLDCQSWSGSAFSEQAIIREEALIATGPIIDYSFQSPSGSTSTQHLCGVCHARVWNSNTARPGITLIRAGTLDVSDRLTPRAHIWAKRKQPWIVIADDIATFPENAPLAEFVAIMSC